MLNGAHSALAYIGLGRGHAFVHQAIADPEIRPVIERLMLGEAAPTIDVAPRSEEHTSELQSLMRISYAVFCLKKKNTNKKYNIRNNQTHSSIKRTKHEQAQQ